MIGQSSVLASSFMFLFLSAGVLLVCGCEASSEGASEPVSAGADAAPRAEVDFMVPDVQLGDVQWNSAVPFVLDLLNDSPAPIRVEAIQTSCGCTSVDRDALLGQQIEPGATLQIAGEVRANEHVGDHRETLDVMFDAGQVRTARLEFTVHATYAVSPTDVIFGAAQIDPGAESSPEPRAVVFRSLGAKLMRVEATVPWIAIGRSALSDAETEIALAVRPEHLVAGKNEGTVIIETDDANRPRQVVTVRAVAEAGLRAVPERVFLSPGQNRAVFLLDRGGNRIPVVHVEKGPESVGAFEFDIRANGELEIRRVGAESRGALEAILIAADGTRARIRVYPM